jgi:glutamate formiminotransferase/formiminotetrahydrofolate cyclodeaminase
METCFRSFEVIQEMVERGNPASVTDAAVGALCARSAIMGAFYNVKINAESLDDKRFVNDIIEKGKEIQDRAIEKEKEILDLVDKKMEK